MGEKALRPVERRSTTAAMIWMGSRLSPASITDRKKISRTVGLFVFRYGSRPRIPCNCFRCFIIGKDSLYSVVVIRAPLQGLHCAGRDANA